VLEQSRTSISPAVREHSAIGPLGPEAITFRASHPSIAAPVPEKKRRFPPLECCCQPAILSPEYTKSVAVTVLVAALLPVHRAATTEQRRSAGVDGLAVRNNRKQQRVIPSLLGPNRLTHGSVPMSFTPTRGPFLGCRKIPYQQAHRQKQG
jgi:hypothetical protein